MNMYDIGDEVELTANFVRNGSGVDPTTFTYNIRKPDGTVVPVTFTHDGTGLYSGTVIVDMAGKWWQAADGTGLAQASAELPFGVRPRQVSR